MKTLTYIIACLFMSNVFWAQEDWIVTNSEDLMAHIMASEEFIPESTTYSQSVISEIYNDFKDAEPIEVIHGDMISLKGKEFNVYQKDVFIVQDSKYSLSIETSTKRMVLQNSNEYFTYRKKMDDYLQLASISKEIKRKEEGDYILFSLELTAASPVRFMEYKFTKDNFLKQLIVYGDQPYKIQQEEDNEKKSKMVITFSNTIIGNKVNTRNFKKIKEYISVEGTEVVLLKQYADYELIDLRN